MSSTIRRVGPEVAEELYAVVHAAFIGRPPLDPPAAALAETPDTLRESLAVHGGLMAWIDEQPVAGLVFDEVGPLLALRRFGVVPGARHHGVAHEMIQAAVAFATEEGYDGLTVLAREELPDNIGFWDSNGFTETGRETPYVTMLRPLPRLHTARDAEEMRGLGARLAKSLRAGDVVLLHGELGAGKTTFTQGLGAGLGVRGDVTSPTFVIARVHPSLDDGPALVHVDAYRLGGSAELDDLDLDTSLDEAVTVVEWGGGIAEALSDERLEVRIRRTVGGEDDEADGPDVADGSADERTVELRPVGARWLGVSL
jgi:tRNA threonylcarbamoyladenosine biosynthesis protein TsaE